MTLPQVISRSTLVTVPPSPSRHGSGAHVFARNIFAAEGPAFVVDSVAADGAYGQYGIGFRVFDAFAADYSDLDDIFLARRN